MTEYVRIKRMIRRGNYDVVHSMNSAVYVGALAAKKIGIKHVWHIREFLEEDHNLKFANRKYALKLLNHADAIICVSKSVYKKYASYIDKRKMKVVYNGVPIVEMKDLKFSKILNILMIGRISEKKGQKQAVEALKEMINDEQEDVLLTIVGDGNKDELREYIEPNRLKEYINLMNYTRNVNDLRKKADIALVCSKQEAFGRVTVEAMMAGNLVIGADTAGTAELIMDGKTGILYKEGNANDLCKKIEWAKANQKKCREICKNARNVAVKKYSVDTCVDNIYRLYASLILENKTSMYSHKGVE